jgi:glutaredoxin
MVGRQVGLLASIRSTARCAPLYAKRVYNQPMHDVVVYSRKGCHLCDVVKDTLIRLDGQADFQWREVDIDTDPELRQQYNDQVPVVFINGRKAFKYHMEEQMFLRAMAARA